MGMFSVTMENIFTSWVDTRNSSENQEKIENLKATQFALSLPILKVSFDLFFLNHLIFSQIIWSFF